MIEFLSDSNNRFQESLSKKAVFPTACFQYVDRRISGAFRLITFTRVRGTHSCGAGCSREGLENLFRDLFLSELDYGLVSCRQACYRLVCVVLIPLGRPPPWRRDPRAPTHPPTL